MSVRTRTTAVAAALVLGSGLMLAGCGDDDEGGDVTTNIEENVEDGADEIEDGADKAGDEIEDGTDKAGDKIEDGTDKAGDEIEDGADDVKQDP